MRRARVSWSPLLGVWIAQWGAFGPDARGLTANGLTAASAFNNLQTLYDRYAQSERQAKPAAGKDPGASDDATVDQGHPGSRCHAPGKGGRHLDDRDEAVTCPCGCGVQIILNWHRKRYAWVRFGESSECTPTDHAKAAELPVTGYAYDWRGQPGSERRRLTDEFDRLCIVSGIEPIYSRAAEAEAALQQAQATRQQTAGPEDHDARHATEEQDPACPHRGPVC